LKDRVEELEERLKDFSVPQANYTFTASVDQEAIESKLDTLSSRLAILEQQSKAFVERQTKDLEAMAKERAQHYALVSRTDRVEAAERNLSRQVEQIESAAAEQKEKAKLQGIKLEAQQEGLQKQGSEIDSHSTSLSKLQSKIKELEEETQKAVMATLEERATRERAVEDVQRTCKQNMQTEMTKLEQKLSKQVADCVAGNQAQAEHLGELAQQTQQDRQENAKATKKLETDTKQSISASQAQVEQQLNTKLQEMQQNLQSFLRKQDAALQQRFHKELEENACSVKQQQDMLSGRLDGIKVDQGFCSKTLDRIEKDLLVYQETQATFKDATDRRIGELSVELQRIKVSQEASLNQSAVQEKITSEIRSLKDGINSIKLTVDGNERMPSRPSSPSGDARSAGPLLRPLYCRPTAVAPPQAWQVQGVRVRSISPPKRAVPAGFLPKPPSQEPMDTPDVNVPARISVSCHNIPGIPAINGEYHRVPGESANGMPLWKHVGSELWLYCGTNRRWFVGGQDAKEWKFRCEAGFIYSEPVEKGTTPDRAPGTWARFQGGMFLADPTILVKAQDE